VSQLRDVVEIVARALADEPQRVVVTEVEHGGTILIEVAAAPPDVGKIIGRQGRTIASMRTLVAAAAERGGKKVAVEIRDTAAG
jgi:uncharacterized protein